MRSPLSSTSAAMSPLSPSSSTSTIRPSVRFAPRLSGDAAQERGEQGRVELIGVVEGGRDLVGILRSGSAKRPICAIVHGHRVIARVGDTVAPSCAQPQPILVEADLALAAAEGAERMDVAVADRAPSSRIRCRA